MKTNQTLKMYIENLMDSLYKQLTNTLNKSLLTSEDVNDVKVIRSKIEVLESITKICKARGRY